MYTTFTFFMIVANPTIEAGLAAIEGLPDTMLLTTVQELSGQNFESLFGGPVDGKTVGDLRALLEGMLADVPDGVDV